MTMSCSISAVHNGVTIDAWSGTLFQDVNKNSVLTSFYPLAKCLPCSLVNKLRYMTSYMSSSLIHNVDLKICWKSCDINSTKIHKINVENFTAWRSVKFEKSLKKLLEQVSGWESDTKPKEKPCCDSHNPDVFASWFMMLQFDDNRRLGKTRVNINEDSLVQGSNVWTFSYPFGSPLLDVFSCCASKGIICNHEQSGLLLIDARCLPGSQGGSIYSEKCLFSGVIVSPLCNKTGELSGMNVACTIYEVARSYRKECSSYIDNNSLQNIFSALNEKSPENVFSRNPTTSLYVDTFCKSKVATKTYNPEVVILKHHVGWGSGVVVAIKIREKSSKIHIATCKHVVGPSIGHSTLHAMLFTGSYDRVLITKTNIEYVSDIPCLDFALVSITVNNSLALKLLNKMPLKKLSTNLHVISYEKNPTQGQEVVSKGHCLLESSEYKPTLTQGVVSSIVYSPLYGGPTLLHSSCIVHDGASGGALLSPNQDKLYGILVNNVKEIHDDTKSQVLYPDVNFSLPACLFMPHVVGFCRGNSFKKLEKLMGNDSSWEMISDENLKSKL